MGVPHPELKWSAVGQASATNRCACGLQSSTSSPPAATVDHRPIVELGAANGHLRMG